jgi:YXWGXW repeat-containing protein
MNTLKKSLLGLMVAASFGAIAVPAAQAEIIVQVAPPADRYERVPGPRRGYVWEGGHWRWNGHRHVWVRGHWERNRHGYVYVAPRWEERDGRWVYNARRWDRDRDGIPNRVDRDRDGDGVPNRLDRRPDNPNRS